MKRFAPAAARNRDPILEVLRRVLPTTTTTTTTTTTVLEIASGTGEHAVHFAGALPHLSWQPTDADADARASIDAWVRDAKLPNLAPSLPFNTMEEAWPLDVETVDAIVAINMIHIAPWEATLGLFKMAQARLETNTAVGAPVVLYGPYRRAGVATAPSNEAFDADLKRRNPAWGLRDLEAVVAVANDAGFDLDVVETMPANNLVVVFRRRPS